MKKLEKEYKKNEAIDGIIERLNEFDWQERLEILANIFITYGLHMMKIDQPHVTPEIAVNLVITDIKKNGNTIANSLVMQGVTILEWLSRES